MLKNKYSNHKHIIKYSYNNYYNIIILFIITTDTKTYDRFKFILLKSKSLKNFGIKIYNKKKKNVLNYYNRDAKNEI